MKRALITDWLEDYGGAEQLVTAILNLFPSEIDLWTSFDNRSLKDPISFTPISPFLTGSKRLAALASTLSWKFGKFDAKHYSLVVSSHHFMAHQSATLDVPHASYVHTPARYVWRMSDDQRLASPFLLPLRSFIKRIDKSAAKRVSTYACNSRFTQKQISEYWGRESRVIYPFIQSEFFDSPRASYAPIFDEYLLFVGRAAKEQAIRKSINIAKAAKIDLLLVVNGNLNPSTQKMIKEQEGLGIRVKIMHSIEIDELINLYKGAIALIHPYVEDFGMSVVESIAVGTPVIAPNRGGSNETIFDGQNGFLVEIEDTQSWLVAIDAASRLDKSKLSLTVNHFNELRFQREVVEWLNNV